MSNSQTRPFAYPSGYTYRPLRLLDATYTLVASYFAPEYACEQVISLPSTRRSFFAEHTRENRIVLSGHSPYVWVHLLLGDATYLLRQHEIAGAGEIGRNTYIEALFPTAVYRAKFALLPSSFSTATRPHWNLRVHPEVSQNLGLGLRSVMPGYFLQAMLQCKNLLKLTSDTAVDLTVVDDTYTPARGYSEALSSWIKVYGLEGNFLEVGNELCFQAALDRVTLWNPRNPFASLLEPVSAYVASQVPPARSTPTPVRQTLDFVDSRIASGAYL